MYVVAARDVQDVVTGDRDAPSAGVGVGGHAQLAGIAFAEREVDIFKHGCEIAGVFVSDRGVHENNVAGFAAEALLEFEILDFVHLNHPVVKSGAGDIVFVGVRLGGEGLGQGYAHVAQVDSEGVLACCRNLELVVKGIGELPVGVEVQVMDFTFFNQLVLCCGHHMLVPPVVRVHELEGLVGFEGAGPCEHTVVNAAHGGGVVVPSAGNGCAYDVEVSVFYGV